MENGYFIEFMPYTWIPVSPVPCNEFKHIYRGIVLYLRCWAGHWWPTDDEKYVPAHKELAIPWGM